MPSSEAPLMFEQIAPDQFRIAEKSRLKSFQVVDKDIKVLKQMKVSSPLTQIESCARYDMLVLINADGNLQAIQNSVIILIVI